MRGIDPREFVRQSRMPSGSPVHTAVDRPLVNPTSQLAPTSKFVVPVFAAAGSPMRNRVVVPPSKV